MFFSNSPDARRSLPIPQTCSSTRIWARKFEEFELVFWKATFRELARYSTLAIGIIYFVFACSAPYLIEKVGYIKSFSKRYLGSHFKGCIDINSLLQRIYGTISHKIYETPFQIGRRPLSLFQLTGCLLALILLSIFTYLQNYLGVIL